MLCTLQLQKTVIMFQMQVICSQAYISYQSQQVFIGIPHCTISQGRAGRCRAGQDRAGRCRAGRDRAGQGRAGQGRGGLGRAGQTRAGQTGRGRAGEENPQFKAS